MPTTISEGGRPYLPHWRGFKQLAQSPVTEEMGRERLESPCSRPMLGTHSHVRQKERAGPIVCRAQHSDTQDSHVLLNSSHFTEKKTEAREVKQLT